MLSKDTRQTYQGIADYLLEQTQIQTCPIIGINGSQGSGKSTLARFLQQELASRNCRAAILSIDDLYLSRATRLELAKTIHPLLATRGVPGTHELALGQQQLTAMQELPPGALLRSPRFSKAADDRLPTDQWPRLRGPFDLILFEGWCVGLPPQETKALAEPINELESREDPQGRWRRWVNQQLAGPYQDLFARLDRLIFLQVPSFALVQRWREQQEFDTARREKGDFIQSPAQLRRFIQHYERLTRHALEVLPDLCDVQLELDAEHRPASLKFHSSP